MKERKNPNVWLAMSMFLLLMVSTAVGRIIYVDADASGANDGSSWANACNYLQLGLNFAQYGEGDEVRVAQGIYKPYYGTGCNRGASFRLIGGVTIKGGYAGFGEPDPDARDVKAYKTILSGDLAGDDVEVARPQDLLDHPARADNSYHVVTTGGYGCYSGYGLPILDGFTITGGNANGTYLNNCGGGIDLYYDDVIITDCVFINNSAIGGPWGSFGGGAMAFQMSRVIFTRCSFIHNATERNGGAVCMYDDCGTCRDSYGEFKDCRFINNYAGANGGGLYYGSSLLTNLVNCIIAGNTAGGSGGGLYQRSDYGNSVVNCTFSGNSASSYGGGIYNRYHHGSPTLTNCILWGDTPDEISGVSTGSEANVTFSDIEGGWWGEGNIDADPCFVQPGYWADADDPNIILEPDDENAVWVDGDYHLLRASPCLNAGDPNYVAEPSAGRIPNGYCYFDPGSYIATSSERDFDGEPRVIGSRVDMGAYEHWLLVTAEVRIVPRTINPASSGRWITCYIWLPDDCNVADIDPGSIRLEDEIGPRWMWFDEQKQVVKVRFKRSEVQSVLGGLEPGDVELTVTGELSDGTGFEGTDVIRVMDKGGKK